MNLIILSILLIALFQQQYFAQIAPPNDLFYEFMDPSVNSLRSDDANFLSPYTDDASAKLFASEKMKKLRSKRALRIITKPLGLLGKLLSKIG
ncbi:hypothetical protein X798_04367 [Onchocerca flexuosa]|uniref:Uncharacterized protein n=1 Tax=Onchocerca flexuosa TaxID=387005 RepID=A0A238BUA2_9BILA|nr:hypothetical protein X798_04367 [Onchocerca flexuosa]